MSNYVAKGEVSVLYPLLCYTISMKDDILTGLTDRMVELKAEKPSKTRTKGDIHKDMIQNIALTNAHLRTAYPGNSEAKRWIRENDKFIKDLMSRG